jgi:hypothetical protein
VAATSATSSPVKPIKFTLALPGLPKNCGGLTTKLLHTRWKRPRSRARSRDRVTRQGFVPRPMESSTQSKSCHDRSGLTGGVSSPVKVSHWEMRSSPRAICSPQPAQIASYRNQSCGTGMGAQPTGVPTRTLVLARSSPHSFHAAFGGAARRATKPYDASISLASEPTRGFEASRLDCAQARTTFDTLTRSERCSRRSRLEELYTRQLKQPAAARSTRSRRPERADVPPGGSGRVVVGGVWVLGRAQASW